MKLPAVSGIWSVNSSTVIVPWEVSRRLLAGFGEGAGRARAHELFGDALGDVTSVDFTDGVRITFKEGGVVVHLRPSGNAPEFRVYTESDTEETAVRNNQTARDIVEKLKDRVE